MKIKLKEECGLIYYQENGKWKIAGRKNHPLTYKFIKLLKGESDENTCMCGSKC